MTPVRATIALVATVGAATALLRVASRPSVWGAARPATCMPDHCFCEAIRDQLVRQPANAVSGLAFVFVGLLILLAGTPDPADRAMPSSPMRSRRTYPVLLAAAVMVVGTGTVLYHASLSFWAQTFDVLGMYLVATFVVIYNLTRLGTLTAAGAATLFGVGNALLLAGLIVFPQGRRFVFAALVLLGIGLELGARRKEGHTRRASRFAAAVLLLAAGFAVWVGDITGALCDSHGWLQGHALWHVAGAAAMWLLFLHWTIVPARRG